MASTLSIALALMMVGPLEWSVDTTCAVLGGPVSPSVFPKLGGLQSLLTQGALHV